MSRLFYCERAIAPHCRNIYVLILNVTFNLINRMYFGTLRLIADFIEKKEVRRKNSICCANFDNSNENDEGDE